LDSRIFIDAHDAPRQV
jgi:hypothetical protein